MNWGPLTSNSMFIGHLCMILTLIVEGKETNMTPKHHQKGERAVFSPWSWGNKWLEDRICHEDRGCYMIKVAEWSTYTYARNPFPRLICRAPFCTSISSFTAQTSRVSYSLMLQWSCEWYSFHLELPTFLVYQSQSLFILKCPSTPPSMKPSLTSLSRLWC